MHECVSVSARARQRGPLPPPFPRGLGCLREDFLGYTSEAKQGRLGPERRGGGRVPQGYENEVTEVESELLSVFPLLVAACGPFHSLLSFKSTVGKLSRRAHSWLRLARSIPCRLGDLHSFVCCVLCAFVCPETASP